MKRKFKYSILTMILVILFTILPTFGASAASSAKAKPEITSFKAVSASGSSITLSWKAKNKAQSYRIYKYNTKNKEYKKIADTEKLTYTVSKLKPMTKYTFGVRAYKKVNGKKVSSPIKKLTCYTKLDKVTAVKQTSATSNKQTISWRAVKGANGYQIAYYNKDTGKYMSLGTVKSNSCTFGSLSPTEIYKYKVRAYAVKSDGKKVYGAYSSALSAVTKPAKVASFRADSVSANGVTLRWKKDAKADGYRIYIYDKKSEKYTDLATVRYTSCYVMDSLSPATNYTFAIRSFISYGGKNYYSALSPALKVTTAPRSVSVFQKNDAPNNQTAVIGWNKAARASGYLIYTSSNPDSGYTLTATVRDANTVEYTLNGLQNDMPVYVRIKPYITVSGKNIYGAFSKPLEIKA